MEDFENDIEKSEEEFDREWDGNEADAKKSESEDCDCGKEDCEKCRKKRAKQKGTGRMGGSRQPWRTNNLSGRLRLQGRSTGRRPLVIDRSKTTSHNGPKEPVPLPKPTEYGGIMAKVWNEPEVPVTNTPKLPRETGLQVEYPVQQMADPDSTYQFSEMANFIERPIEVRSAGLDTLYPDVAVTLPSEVQAEIVQPVAPAVDLQNPLYQVQHRLTGTHELTLSPLQVHYGFAVPYVMLNQSGDGFIDPYSGYGGMKFGLNVI
jgi:hypothetical protein